VAVGLFKKNYLNTTTLLRAASVMRHWRHVGNHVDANAEGS
jgi:hypothetical protein